MASQPPTAGYADLHQTSLLACRYRCHIQQRTAAGTISCNIYYAAKKLPAEPVPDCLLALDLLLQDTLDSNFDYRDGSVYHAVLDSALRSRGWRSLTGGRTYATKIETALLNLYGSYIPTADLSTKQLHATLCSKSVAPRYVLQLAVLLGLSLHDLLHAPDAVPDYKAEMKAMYQSGASMYHIAQLYGIDAKTVARWIKS